MKIYEVSSYKAQKEQKKGTVLAFPAVRGVCISPSTYNKSILAVILKAQATLYGRWFTRYGKSCNFVIIYAPKTKNCIFIALLVV